MVKIVRLKKKTLNKAIKKASDAIFYVEYESLNSIRVLQVAASNAKEARKKAERKLSECCAACEIKNISAV